MVNFLRKMTFSQSMKCNNCLFIVALYLEYLFKSIRKSWIKYYVIKLSCSIDSLTFSYSRLKNLHISGEGEGFKKHFIHDLQKYQSYKSMHVCINVKLQYLFNCDKVKVCLESFIWMQIHIPIYYQSYHSKLENNNALFY